MATGGPVKDLKETDVHDINILLLGETGVGKSTFINSIANYFHFKNFKHASKNDLLILVPSVITVLSEDHEQVTMDIGFNKNEYQEVGAAGTQNVKTYVFPIYDGKTRLRLIDSPGMGDPRGIEQDDINCENILTHLSQLEELHAICILMRPTTTRITAFFKYCVDQILSRLEKSASNNIIFIFTNTRGTDFTPGDTLPCLRKVIDEIKENPPHVGIPLKGNIFSLDNEAFKYLAAMNHGIKVDKRLQEHFTVSWNRSSKECWRLFSYIIGDAAHAPLKPHKLQNTVSVNEVRRLIIYLSKPLADISELIHDNIRILERHQLNLSLENLTLNELKKKLYIPIINLKVIELANPVTVCTSTKCAEMVKVGEVSKWHYRQRCHDPCGLKHVTKEIIGDPSLQGCSAMTGRKCRKCSCDFTVHMHVYYMTETVEDKIVDNVVQKNIRKKKAALETAQKLVEEIDQRKKELEDEHNMIVKSTAEFAHFLQHNAISPFSDSYKAYIEYLIKTERSCGRYADHKIIDYLEQLLQRYKEIKAAFDRSLELSRQDLNAFASSITPQNVLDTINELYRLKHNGNKIYELIEKQKKSRNAEYNENCEYIHPKTANVTEFEAAVVNKQDKSIGNDGLNGTEQFGEVERSDDKNKSEMETANAVKKTEKNQEKNQEMNQEMNIMEMMKALMRTNQEIMGELRATREENEALKKQLEESK